MSNATCTDAVDGPVIDTLAVVTLLVICFIALATGTNVVVDDLRLIWQSKRRAFLIGWASQFGFMPCMAYLFALAFDFDKLVAVGVVLVGMSPGGSTSNLFTMWAKGNVALSIAMSAASTVCAFFMIPLLFVIYVRGGLGLNDELSLPVTNLLIALFSIVVPVAAGAYIRHANTSMEIGGKRVYKWVELVGSVVGGGFLVAAIISGASGNPDLMNPGDYPRHWALAAIFQPIGCLFGLAAAHAARLPGADVRAVCLETGVQNYALIIALVQLSFSGCTQERVNEFVLISSLWYVISSVWLTLALRLIHARLYPPGEDAASDGPRSDGGAAGKASATSEVVLSHA